MKFKQIGNGGAFNHKMPNSSFLIESNDEYILFDCGFSVFNELRFQDEDGEIDLKKLSAVYISHLDDDHVGSLKALIYYMFFVHGTRLQLFSHDDIGLDNFLSDMNSRFEEGNWKTEKYFESYTFTEKEYWNGLTLMLTNTEHHVPCYGLILKEDIDANISVIYISGDTKATTEIRQYINAIFKLYKNYKIFHDFSMWDCPENQVHACESDINLLYPEKMIDKLNWYHNDAEFNLDWEEI